MTKDKQIEVIDLIINSNLDEETRQEAVQILEEGFNKNIIAGIDFKSSLDSLANITGSKLSDMLGKKEDTGSPYNEENRSWLKHKEFCNGCALCEL
jgi:hypothetical protein